MELFSEMPSRIQGFNLLELLILIAVIGILTVTAVPAFINYLQTRRLVGASEQLYYALQYARSEAVKRNTTVYVSFQTGSNWCYGINANTTCSCNVANSCGLGSTQAPASGSISLAASGLTNNALHFEPNHGAANASSTLTFTASGPAISASVKVGLLGNPFLCSSQITGYAACS
ncbi:hypothetical protein AQUSIP_08760 [Aquicella siphonis]|uniref:Type II secretion system protein H n=1 Tax=Aquicella siphonis TaxID=254247 RepID=A0A5E4PGV2_9COXI|nr:GspH/FimT family pseudopilin [Aquicella siphonis]VVC75586.1 hypothetical protein AQUSIP_08760 [Aquicella siphonis]